VEAADPRAAVEVAAAADPAVAEATGEETAAPAVTQTNSRLPEGPV